MGKVKRKKGPRYLKSRTKFGNKVSHGKRSQLERTFQALLKAHKIDYSYEKEVFEIISPLSFTTYERRPLKGKKKKFKEIKSHRKTTYTPDFTGKVGKVFWIIEVKGFRTNEFNLKWKLFLLHISKNYKPEEVLIMMPTTKSDMLECIKQIKSLNHKNDK